MTNWLLYTIPEERQLHYLICLFIALVVVPDFILNVAFTITHQFLNFLGYDVLYYYMLKRGYFN